MFNGEVLPFGRGQPGRFKLDNECTETGEPIENNKVFIGEKKAEARLLATLEKAREAKENPAVTPSKVKRYYLKNGSIVEFGPGPVTFEKWQSQVMGSDNPTLCREGATEEEFASWKQAQGYKQGGAVAGAAQSKIAALEAQIAANNALLARLAAKLDEHEPATKPAKAGKAQG